MTYSPFYPWYFARNMYKMDIGLLFCISTASRILDLDDKSKRNTISVIIYRLLVVYVMAHDAARGIKGDVYPIGVNCFIGIASIILPGVHIGSNCIVGTGTVVTKDFSGQ